MRDPVLLAHRELVLERLDRHVAPGAAGRGRDRERDRPGEADEQAVRISRSLELLAVHRQQVVALVHADTGSGQRTAIVGAAVVARVDFGEAIAAGGGVQRVVRAQQRGRHRLGPVAVVAVVGIGVRVAQLALDLADQPGEIRARAEQRQQPGVFVVHRFPVVAVHRRIEEQVALQPPRILEHLRPFLAGIDARAHVVELEGLVVAVAGLRVGDMPALVHRVEHALAVGGQGVAVQPLHHDVVLARIEVEHVQGGFLARHRAFDQGARLRQVEHVPVARIHRRDRRGLDR